MEPNPADLIIVLPPDAPAWQQFGANLLLYAHIIGASVGMIAGTVAMIARKGEPLHRAAGNVFFVGMLAMTGVGATVSPFLPEAQWTNTTAGAFTLYLVLSGWATVKRPEGRIGAFEVAAFLFAFGLALTGLTLYLLKAGSGAFGVVYFFAVLAAIAALCDLGVILKKGIAGHRRIARHLWRMALALMIALGSFFLGQQDELPVFVQGSPVLFAPMLTAFGLLIFWLIRARFTRAFQSAPSAMPDPAAAPAEA